MQTTSATLTNTTVAIPADKNRLGLIIANHSATAMTYSPDGTATASVGIEVPVSNNIILIGDAAQALIKNAGTLFCAGTSCAYTFITW